MRSKRYKLVRAKNPGVEIGSVLVKGRSKKELARNARAIARAHNFKIAMPARGNPDKLPKTIKGPDGTYTLGPGGMYYNLKALRTEPRGKKARKRRRGTVGT